MADRTTSIAFPVCGFTNITTNYDTTTWAIGDCVCHAYGYLARLTALRADGINDARARRILASITGIEDRITIGRPTHYTACSGLKGKPLRCPAIGRHHIDFAGSLLAACKRQQFAIWRKLWIIYFVQARRQSLSPSALTRYEPEVVLSDEHNTILVDGWKAYISLGRHFFSF